MNNLDKKIRRVSILLLLFIFAVFVLIAEGRKVDQNLDDVSSKVYFTSDVSADGVLKVFEKIQEQVHGKIAIKVHFGEEGNNTFLPAHLVQKLTEKLRATLVETNVLYVGKRRYTESHIKLARQHGFTFAAIDILDSEGEKILPVKTTHYNEVKVGKHMDNYDSFVIFSHFKGHGMAGFGGAIKNVSMGLAAVSGKMALHASTIPVYYPDRCTKCNLCPPECPGKAITIDPLVIDADKCIGCGTCIGICPFSCFGVPWGSTERSVFLERLVDYAKGIEENYDMVFINVLANITRSCDCVSWPQTPFLDDIGILASTDIVAIENASHDLVDKACECENTFLKENKVNGKRQIEYAFEMGMGNKNYELINLDE